MDRASLVVACCAALLVLSYATHAAAQRAPRGREPKHGEAPKVVQNAAELDARRHLTRAAAAAQAKDWHLALSEYYAANAASRSIAGLEGIANAHYQLGHDSAALDAYTELLRTPPLIKPGDTAATAMWAAARATAEKRVEELNARKPATAPPPKPAAPAPPPPPAHPVPVVDQGADPRLWTEHAHATYTTVRAPVPPKIDGKLDDPIWKVAPIDNRFRDINSKPFGIVAKDSTAVQVAYDDDYIYVGFRCGYSHPDERDDSYPPDETSLQAGSESVSVQIDARHDHTNARAFVLTRTGMRVDGDITLNGTVLNLDWRGVWDGASSVQANADTWTAEYAIPWSTLGLPPHDGDFSIGINFRRVIPRDGVRVVWSMTPPAPNGPNPPSFAGHLLGLSNVHPGKTLYVEPFVIGKYRSDRSVPLSRLRDFTGTNGNLSGYGGLYARYRPVGPLQVDLAVNPDFSQVPPDQAVSNLDRFELIFPETRPFFAEDRGRFELGGDNAQLFYSRRVGLRATGPASSPVYTEVPIIYGGKGILREGGTEASVMNVGLSTPDPRIRSADNISVVRLNHLFGRGDRVGTILLMRRGDLPRYMAAGVDGAVSFMNENLIVSGFAAESATAGVGSGGVAQGDIHWDSADFEARLTYLDVAGGFDGQLGYFPQTGIKSVTALGGYTPIVHNDFVHEVDIRAQFARTRTQADELVYDRGTLTFQALMINRSLVSVQFLPAIEGVLKPFTLANGRVTIPVGRYDVNNVTFSIASPPRRHVEVAIGYTEGELFYGYQRAPQLQLGLNVSRFSGSTLYKLLLLHMGPDRLVGHQVSSRFAFFYTPRARSALAIEANTLDPRATAQLVNAWTFGENTTIALVLVQSSASVDTWFNKPARSALLSFSYGVSLL